MSRREAAALALLLATVAAGVMGPRAAFAVPPGEPPAPRAVEAGAAPLRYNRVEGVYAGVRAGFATPEAPGPRAAVELGLSTLPRAWRYNLSGGWGGELSPRRPWAAGARAYDLIDSRDGWRTTQWETNLAVLILGSDPRDYTGRRGNALFLRTERGSGRGALLEFRYETVRSLPSHEAWNFRDRDMPPNPATAGGLRRSLHLDLVEGSDDPDDGWRVLAAGDLLTTDPGTGAWFLESRARHEIAGDWRLAGRVLTAGCAGEAPPEWRPALGGVDALRGLAYKELPGQRVVLLSTSLTDGGEVLGLTRMPVLRHLQFWGNLEWGRAGSRSASSAAFGGGDVAGFARIEAARRLTTEKAPWRLYLRLNRAP